jgi:hypothetical protein
LLQSQEAVYFFNATLSSRECLMDERRQRRIQLAIVAFTLVGPLVVAVWSPEWAALALLLGLIIALRALRVMRADALNARSDDPSLQRMQHLQGERGRTVWVSLLDDNGQPLDAAAAERKLAQARAAAGPRDMVVGVRGKVE